jgi:hypothetical protein
VLNLNSHSTVFSPDHAPPHHQLQRRAIVQLRRPAYRKLDPAPLQQEVFGGEEHTRTGDVEGSSLAGLFAAALIQGSIPHLSLDRKPIRAAALGLSGLPQCSPQEIQSFEQYSAYYSEGVLLLSRIVRGSRGGQLTKVLNGNGTS